MSLYLILIPLFGAALLLLARLPYGRPLALLATAINLVVAGVAVYYFHPEGGVAYRVDFPWVASAGIHFRLGVDGISLLLVLLTNILAPFIVLTGLGQPSGSENRYYGLILLMLGALNGVFMAEDGLLFYVFYELALIPIYFICAIWGGEDRIRVTLKFFIYTFAGSLFMLLSLIYLYLHTEVGVGAAGSPGHSFLWEDLLAVSLTAEESVWVSLGFFFAFAVKMPLFPFHTWQPDTYTVAPAGGSMLLSGIMLKMGTYGVIRWMIPLSPESLHDWAPLFVGLSLIGLVYAALIAVKQTDLKRLIAYSSISHVGLIAAGIWVWNKMGVQGSMIQMFNHGINVVGLFYVAELLERRLGTRNLADMGGIARRAPRLAATFMILVLGSIAVPLTNGFPGEFLLLVGVWQYKEWLGVAAGLTIIFGAVYWLRAYGLVMFGPSNDKTVEFEDIHGTELLVLGLLAALVLVLGFYPQILLNLTDAAVNAILGTVQL